MDNFRDFLEQMIGGRAQGPTRSGAGVRRDQARPRSDERKRPAGGGRGDDAALMALLMAMMQGQQQSRAMAPDAGDLFDMNFSNGDPGIMGLFGSNPPALRTPPPGVSKRRGY